VFRQQTRKEMLFDRAGLLGSVVATFWLGNQCGAS
jgi:hypothetical protein